MWGLFSYDSYVSQSQAQLQKYSFTDLFNFTELGIIKSSIMLHSFLSRWKNFTLIYFQFIVCLSVLFCWIENCNVNFAVVDHCEVKWILVSFDIEVFEGKRRRTSELIQFDSEDCFLTTVCQKKNLNKF